MEGKQKLQSRNVMSAVKLVETENELIKFIPNPQKKGRLFFTCGSITGYISPAVRAAVEAGQDIDIDDLQYMETYKEDTKQWIPMLTRKAASKAVLTLGANLLRR